MDDWDRLTPVSLLKESASIPAIFCNGVKDLILASIGWYSSILSS